MKHIYIIASIALAGAPLGMAGADLVPATFDDVEYELHLTPQKDPDVLHSGSFDFNGMMGSYGDFTYWSGYSFSKETSFEYASLDDQYRSAAGGGHLSAGFCVAFPEAFTIDVTSDPEGVVIPGAYLTNSAYAYNAMSRGDDYARKFAKNDYFLLTVKGADKDGNEKSVEFYLADMRAESEFDRYILNTWEWLDLSPLGKVTRLSFTLQSTDVSDYGNNTPGYFCIDNLGSGPVRTGASATVKAGETIDLAGFFALPDNGARCVYAIEPAEGVSLDGSTLRVSRSTVVNASMYNAGHTQYIALDVTVNGDAGISEIGADSDSAVAAVEYYRLDGTRIYTPEGICIVRRLDADGRVVSVGKVICR